ncbi:MAG: flagellar hook basal-body protein [Candidatus Margulisiibacteriota bacterium]|nr:flagellar hook basal-body protein [Candidatus Margulisiibacteriota bacterium]
MASDPIFNIGKAGLETTDEKVKALMDRMVNSETPGFKQHDVVIRSFPTELQNAMNRLESSEIPQIDGTHYSFTQGALVRTGSPTDLALGAEGFFVIQCQWGEGYTRDGRFTVDRDGRLVTSVGGYPLLGTNGPIMVNPGDSIEVSQSGEIRANEALVDRIQVVKFENPENLQSVNGSIFKDPDYSMYPVYIESPRVVQGYIESSNADIVDQMMDLMTLERVYNLNTKIVTVRDQGLARAIQMGQVQ